MKTLSNNLIISLGFMVVLFFVVSCKSAKNTHCSTEQLDLLKSKIENSEFKLEFNTAYPFASNGMLQVANAGLLAPGDSANRINLSGTSNYFKVFGDSISAQLPFFGESRVGGGTYGGRNIGVDIDGKLKNYQMNYNEKKKVYEITFEAEGANENYDGNLLIFSTGGCQLNLTGSRRTPIRYSGSVILKEMDE